MKWLIESRNSEFVRWNFFACSVSPDAKESRPTRVAWYSPLPATTKEPDIASWPGSLSTGSASPVSRLSSISRPSATSSTPSTTSWSPVVRTMRSSSTTSCGLTATSAPSRRTTGLASPITASLASVREARHSWTMPMPVLATMTNPNSESLMGATMSMRTQSVPISPLNHVNVLARMMSDRDRLRASGAALTWP